MPATPSATSVRPVRHGRPIVSETITTTSRPNRSRRSARRARADASGSLGSSTRWLASTLDASMPAAFMMKPWWVWTIRMPGRRRHHSRRLGGQDLGLARRAFGALARHLGQVALGLRHDLAGHHEHVAVDDPRRGGGDQRGQVIARLHVTDAHDGLDDQVGHYRTPASFRASDTISAVAFSSVIHSGVARTSTLSTEVPASVGVDQPAVQDAAGFAGPVEITDSGGGAPARRARPGTCRPCRGPARRR